MTEQHNIMLACKEVVTAEKALQLLTQSVRASSIEPDMPGEQKHSVLKTFSVRINLEDSLGWLARQELFPRIYWMNREKTDCVAGIGEADRIELDCTAPNERSFLELDAAIREKHPQARYFGGFSFNNEENRDPLWKGFTSFVFILPLVQVTGNETGTTLSCHLWLKPGDDRGRACDRLIDALSSVRDTEQGDNTPELPELLKVSYNPDRTRWEENCNNVLNSFETGSMEKVMLARQTALEFAEPFSPLLFMMKYPFPGNSTYRFYFEPLRNRAFLSFSPERLYRRDGEELLTEALAGTVTKKTSGVDDEEASELLLNSEKDIREHRFVMDTIYHELRPLCSDLYMEEEVEVLQLNRLAHLYARCRARLMPQYRNDSAVLRQLHPTPAVGGVPRDQAMELILSIEPFSRGWYAAPVGWISHEAAEFAVGIRSALVSGDKAYLYSGAGLVRGSNPYSEWEEVDQKIGDILAITRQPI